MVDARKELLNGPRVCEAIEPYRGLRICQKNAGHVGPHGAEVGPGEYSEWVDDDGSLRTRAKTQEDR